MTDYEKIHVDGKVIENESSGPRGLTVYVSVDTLGAVIIELGSSMTIRTNCTGATELAETLRDAVTTLDEMRYTAAARVHEDESWGQSEREISNDPASW